MREGKADNLTRARADALTELIFEHTDVRVVVHATRAQGAAAGETKGPVTEDGGWCEVGGLGGPGTTVVPTPWLAAATATQTASGGLTCHPVTGALVGGDVPAGLATGRDTTGTSTTGTTTYRIPAAMVRFIRLRDGGCRFPGCSTPARQCDLDHVRPWPTGPTHPSNLIALCRRHHRIKQRDGWTVRLYPDCTLTWTDPTGTRHTTHAVNHLHLGATTPRAREAQPARRTHHIDLSLLEDDLGEWIAHGHRLRTHHRADGALRELVHITYAWPQGCTYDPPPREPRPEVIPF